MNIRPWSTSPAKYIAVNACLRPLAAVHEMDVSRIIATANKLLLLMIFDELGLTARASSQVPEVTASSLRGVP